MSRNEGMFDRLVRVFALAPFLVLIGVAFGAATLGGVVAWVLSAVVLVTGAVGFCPAYALVHVRTNDRARSR